MINQGFLKPSKHPVITAWTNVSKSLYYSEAFIGQLNHNGQIEGLFRTVQKDGWFYEGFKLP